MVNADGSCFGSHSLSIDVSQFATDQDKFYGNMMLALECIGPVNDSVQSGKERTAISHHDWICDETLSVSISDTAIHLYKD